MIGLLSRAASFAAGAKPPAADAGARGALEREFARFHGALSGVLLEAQAGSALNSRAGRMLAAFGAAIPLKPAAAAPLPPPSPPPRMDRSLALFPADRDRELITHRLTHSLRAKRIFVFEAANPAQAFSWLKSYL
jgi:hypothetical protein